MNELVDTTQMYLRTVLELEEEGVVPRRARIAERLRQSGPTVSQTVARMERDGLLTIEDDRRLRLSDSGRSQAIAVMRKHRLAELLLVTVIGMPYENAHDEACRWEHVMSEAVENRVYELLGHPTRSPYGNPIPGLADLDKITLTTFSRQEYSLSSSNISGIVTIVRICESIQSNKELLRTLHNAGIDPGAPALVAQRGEIIIVEKGGVSVTVPRSIASRIFVMATEAASPMPPQDPR